MENSDKAFTNWFVLMCVAHSTAVFGLAMVEQLEKKPKAKQEPTRVSIQLVRAVPPPPQNQSYHHLLSRFLYKLH